jgi:hypothetical protein
VDLGAVSLRVRVSPERTVAISPDDPTSLARPGQALKLSQLQPLYHTVQTELTTKYPDSLLPEDVLPLLCSSRIVTSGIR